MDTVGMNWIQVVTIVGANFGLMLVLFLWLRSEANADRRDICGLIKEIQNEMKDFHGRLVAIEERTSTKIVK